MKKITTIFAIVFALLFISNSSVYAQAFQKGNINLDLGVGFGAYGTRVVYEAAGLEFSETDGAASTIVPIGFEYGISDRFGLGLQFGFVNYCIDNDSNEFTESVKSVDFALKFNFHLLNSDRNDLFLSLGLGGSAANWTFKNTTETYSGSGSYFSFSLVDRIFFNDNVGISFNLGYVGYNYSNMESSNNNPFLDGLKWSLKGVNLGTGLAVKF